METTASARAAWNSALLWIERDGFFRLLDGIVPALEGGGDFGHFVPGLRVVGVGLETLGENGLGAAVMALLDESGGGRVGGVERTERTAVRIRKKMILDIGRDGIGITEIPESRIWLRWCRHW